MTHTNFLKKLTTYLIVTSFSFGAVSTSVYAQAYNERIEQQELELRRLTGEVETLKYQNLRYKKDLDALRKEMNLRFEMLAPPEATKETVPESTEEKSKENKTNEDTYLTVPEKTKTDKTAILIYEAAQADLQRKDYSAAAKGFERIIAQYPDNKLTPNAYYWLGETHYSRKEYDKAAINFLDGKRKFPNSPKAGHSLYKLAMSLYFLGEEKEACITLDEVEKNYLPKDLSLKDVIAKGRMQAKCS